MELEGTLLQKLAVQNGKSAKGDWSKQDFIVEYQDGNFPTKVCLNVWGADKVKDLERFRPGDKIRVSFSLSSREYNGRWYNDIRAWRITPSGAQSGAQSAPQGDYGYSAQPQSAPAPATSFDDNLDSNDLPF